MRISDWSSDVCSSDLCYDRGLIREERDARQRAGWKSGAGRSRIGVRDRLRGLGTPVLERLGRCPAQRLAWRRAGRHAALAGGAGLVERSEEHTSELQSLMRISYAVFCLKKNTKR